MAAAKRARLTHDLAAEDFAQLYEVQRCRLNSEKLPFWAGQIAQSVPPEATPSFDLRSSGLTDSQLASLPNDAPDKHEAWTKCFVTLGLPGVLFSCLDSQSKGYGVYARSN